MKLREITTTMYPMAYKHVTHNTSERIYFLAMDYFTDSMNVGREICDILYCDGLYYDIAKNIEN
jgi:hypothetical protein